METPNPSRPELRLVVGDASRRERKRAARRPRHERNVGNVYVLDGPARARRAANEPPPEIA